MSNAPNSRVFYACEGVALAMVGTQQDPNLDNAGTLTFVHGVQSVGINTSFNLEQAFELGQVEIYDNVETVPEVEVTIEKVIDGYPFIYHLATSGGPPAENELIQRLKRRANLSMVIGSDSAPHLQSSTSKPGTPRVEVFLSGLFVSSLSYNFPSDGFATESVSLVGNQREWRSMTAFDSYAVNGLVSQSNMKWNAAVTNTIQPPTRSTAGFGQDYPIGSGGITRRQNVDMTKSTMPVSIYGVLGAGTGVSPGNNWNPSTFSPRAHISNITISADIGREDLNELGRRAPYAKAPTFPIEVTSEFEVITVSGDFVQFYADKPSTPQQFIEIVLTNGAKIQLGGRNKLSSINYGGGDTGGGNLTITYSFTTYNELSLTPANLFDPSRPFVKTT